MNKQFSVMGLAARASMVPVLIASGLTALAVGALTYLANPEHTGGAAGVGAAPLAAAVGYLMVMVMLCLGGCGFGSQTLRPFPLRLRKAVVIGDKLCSGHRFTRCQRSPAHAAGAAQAVGFGIQAGLARAVQRLVHQLRAVAQQPHRLPRAFHKPAQGSGGRALVRA